MSSQQSRVHQTPHVECQSKIKQAVMAQLAHHPFREAWWLPGSHLQTVWAPLFRKPPAVPPSQARRVSTPDGDFFVIHVQQGKPENPTVLLLHGLEGSRQSKYIIGLQSTFAALQWSVVVMEFRSCSGQINHARRMYHMGETSDFDHLVNTLITKNPNIELYAAGFSLGGKVLAKWMGEQGDAAPSHIKAAAVISAPYDCVVSGPFLDRPGARVYRRKFLRTLIPKAIEKERQFPGIINVERVRNCTTFVEFDTHVTAALHGFKNATDYWARTSCGQFLPRICRPTMLLSAVDDPFNPGITLPRAHADKSPWLHPQFTNKGGHVGFIGGPNPWKDRFWAEDQVVRFFQAYRAVYQSSSSGKPA